MDSLGADIGNKYLYCIDGKVAIEVIMDFQPTFVMLPRDSRKPK
jgi:hypothetical protein